jgi:hypothetical protein
MGFEVGSVQWTLISLSHIAESVSEVESLANWTLKSIIKIDTSCHFV